MLKLFTLKLMILSSLLLVFPLHNTSFGQEDDFLEEESNDFSDDMLDEEPIDKPVSQSVKKSEIVPPSPVTEQKKANIESIKEDKPAKNEQKNAVVKTPIKVEKKVEYTPPPPPPVNKPTPAIMLPVDSKPKAVFAPITAPELNVKAGTAVKRAGSPLLLIARPVYAPYSNESKTMFISATAEAYFHFKLGSLSGISVVPTERISSSIQYFRDFSRRISATAYKEAAKKIGASYLLYSEYEPIGKKVKFATELYSIADNKKIAGSVTEVELSKFEDGLFDFAIEAASAMVGTLSATTQEFLASPVFGNKGEALGQVIASVGEYNKKRITTLVPQFEKLAKDKSNYLAKFVAADICAQADQFDQAISLIQELNEKFGNQYPGLMLKLAQYYRLSKSFDDALSTVNNVSNEPSLKYPSQIEKARIYEAQGDLQDAKRAYDAALSEGGEDGDVLFQLALVSIGLKDLNKARQYLENAAAAGRSFDRTDYFDLGLRYETIGSANEEAIEAFRNCLGLQQDNAEAWQKLAELYALSGKDAEAAECYFNLFQIDNNLYKDYLKKAGILFENGGYLENAKDVYELFIGRRFADPEVRVRLAKIEMQSGNCPKAVELVDEMDTTGDMGQDVIMINSQCQKQERRVIIPTTNGNKSWKALFYWRVASGFILVGGSAAGYVMDQQLKKKWDEYHNYNITTKETTAAEKLARVAELHSAVETTKKNRDLIYAGAGLGGLSLGLSIVLPIVIH